jgi:hypothetical protein
MPMSLSTFPVSDSIAPEIISLMDTKRGTTRAHRERTLEEEYAMQHEPLYHHC